MNAPDLLPTVGLGMPSPEYHAAPGLGSSALSALARSPWHYWAEYLAPDRPQRPSTPAMLAGTLAHTAILEPDELDRRYVVRPSWVDGRTKDGKAWIDEAKRCGAEIITAEQMATAKAQREAVLAVPELATLLASGQAEVSCFATDPATGVAVKGRMDWVHELRDGRALIVDLKTSADITAPEFARSVLKYGYHRQQAHYTDVYQAATGREVAGFLFATVSATYPFLAVPYMLDDQAVAEGAGHRAKLLRRFAECSSTGIWPKPTEGVQLLSLPRWAQLENVE